ncbi:MAG: hypothetical protein QF722_07015, partial [Candidatus Thalassarchaeaceae archaeon]|nr:hypothetical protein [Candidatus Thalassarchaeaceae archaeon]
VSAHCYLISRPAEYPSLISEFVVPMDGCLPDLGDGDRAMHCITIGDGVDELGLAMYQRERDVVRGQHLVVVQTARELPGLLVESMGHVPEPWIVYDFGQVYHRKVNPPLRDECHAVS